MFDADELSALTLGGRIASAFGDEGLARAAGSALSKIESVLPKHLRPGLGVITSYSIHYTKLYDPQLSPYYKLIMVELLGHGSSDAAPQQESYDLANASALEALRRELGIERRNNFV